MKKRTPVKKNARGSSGGAKDRTESRRRDPEARASRERTGSRPTVATPAKLTVELVPRTCWFTNARTAVTPLEWDRIRRQVYSNAGHKCEICGGRGSAHPVEAHEVWNYDDEKKIQKLVRMVALCPDCHGVKHIGLSRKLGRLPQAISHLMRVNQWSRSDADSHLRESLAVWKQRSLHQWAMDLAGLEQYGVGSWQKPPDAGPPRSRPSTADQDDEQSAEGATRKSRPARSAAR